MLFLNITEKKGFISAFHNFIKLLNYVRSISNIILVFIWLTKEKKYEINWKKNNHLFTLNLFKSIKYLWWTIGDRIWTPFIVKKFLVPYSVVYWISKADRFFLNEEEKKIYKRIAMKDGRARDWQQTFMKIELNNLMSITLISRKYTSIELNDINIENKKIDKIKYNPN